jgi:5-methylcytosine-specific restriction endonuclease McrA
MIVIYGEENRKIRFPIDDLSNLMSRERDKRKGIVVSRRKWKRIREYILKRDKYKCQLCPFKGNSITLTVDHIVPKSRGGALYDPNNLRTLCYPCHREITPSQFKKLENLREYIKFKLNKRK